MSWSLGFGLAMIVGSIALMAYTIKHAAEVPLRNLFSHMMVLMLGFALLVGALIPNGFVGQLTQGVFAVSAAAFLIAAVRAEVLARDH
ncbi:MAG TPA: hypothetical protein VIP11_17230 [Gemmatimonadaceae bacterium]